MNENLPDNPQIQVLKSGKTGLFTNYIYKAIPLAFDESMSYYETLCGLLNYLENVVIPTVNNNADAVAELQSLYEQLRTYVDNYFTNLDVQEEINNKLDDMVEDGTLPEIIASYLNSKAVFGFDNVNSMKESTNLIDGSYAKTLGYYTKNDGGSALYKIRTITNDDVIDNASIISLERDDLIAELISNEVNPIVFGCYGDGTHNDYYNLNKAIEYAKSKNKKIVSPSGKTYLTESTLNFTNINIDFNNSILKTSSNIDIVSINSSNYYGNISNLIIDCNNIANIGINLINSRKHNFYNVTINNIYNIGIKYNSGYENNFNNINLNASGSNNAIGFQLNGNDSNLTNIIIINCKTAIKSSGKNFIDNVHAWISSPSNVLGSIFIDLSQNGYFSGNNIYSDTYQYTFYVNDNTPYVLINNMLCEWNTTDVMTPAVMGDEKPYIYYNLTNTTITTRYILINNLECNGKLFNSNKIPITNEPRFSGIFTNAIKYNMQLESYPRIGSIDSNLTVTVNEMKRINAELVEFDFIASIDATSHNGLITIGNTAYRPTSDLNDFCIYSTDLYGVTGLLYLYINTSGNISINIPNSITGTIYIKIHKLYKTNDNIN